MVVQLVVTPEMIECFHECTEEGKYLKLYEDYGQFFESLKENLCKVNFTEPLRSAIAKEFEFLLNCLFTWDTNKTLPWKTEKNTVNPNLYILKFLPRFHLAMQTKNWNDFYEKFIPIIDLMIETARRNEVIDLKIGFGSELYETFNLRDKAVSPQETQNRDSTICTSGHLSIFDCDSNCRRFLKSLYNSKRVNRKNVVKLVLTEEMINCFHECAEKRDFKKLFKDYSLFFDYLLESLDKVDPATDSLSTFLFKNSKLLLGYLTKWDPNEPLPWDNESIRFESRCSGLIPHLHVAMVIQDWDGFYEHHRQTIDMLIKDARAQELIDLKIEHKGNLYDGFDRDASEQQHFSFFMRKHGRNRYYSSICPSRHHKRLPKSIGTAASKSEKNDTFVAPETGKTEDGVILGIPGGFVADRVAQVKDVIKVRVTEGRKTIPAKTDEVMEVGPTSVPEVKEIEPVKTTEVKQTVPTEKPMVNELGSTRVTEVKAIPKVSSERETENFQLNQKEELYQMESRIQKLLKEQVDLIRIESDKKYKNLENRIHYLEEKLETVETSQRALDEKLKEKESRFESSMEMKLKTFGENLTSENSQNKNEDYTKKLELLEEQLQFRELILHQKIDEIKIREQTLDNRMNELMELMERKMVNSGEKQFPDKPQDDSRNPEKKKIPEKTQEDIEFDKKLAEQLFDYEVRLRRIQAKRKEMNEDSREIWKTEH